MALNPILPITSTAASVTTGSDIVTIKGSQDASNVVLGTIVTIANNQPVIAKSGTNFNVVTGESTITLHQPWPYTDIIDGDLLVQNTYEGLSQAIQRLRQIMDEVGSNQAAIDAQIITTSDLISQLGTALTQTQDNLTLIGDAPQYATEVKEWAVTPVQVLVPSGNLTDEYSGLHYWTKTKEERSLFSTDYTQFSTDYTQFSTDYAQFGTDYTQFNTDYIQFSTDYIQFSTDYTQFSTDYAQFSTDYTQFSTDYTQFNTDYIQFITDYTQFSTDYTQFSTVELPEALGYSNESREWAITTEDVLVPSGNLTNEYSALHYASKAEMSADLAAQSANEAAAIVGGDYATNVRVDADVTNLQSQITATQNIIASNQAENQNDLTTLENEVNTNISTLNTDVNNISQELGDGVIRSMVASRNPNFTYFF